MLGIIAAIIAAVKGHKTFAWVMGVWSALEIVLLLAKSPYAVGPGGLFVIIALCMSNLNKRERVSASQEQKTNEQSGMRAVSSNDADKSAGIEPVIPLQCDVPGYVDCPICHTRQRAGRDRCFGCNVPLKIKPISPLNDNNDIKMREMDTTMAVPSVKPMKEVTTELTPKVRFCRKCGFELLGGSDFCSHCGTKVVVVPQGKEPAECEGDTTTVNTKTPSGNARDHQFWENLKECCEAAQQVFKDEIIPALGSNGFLSTTGSTVNIDIHDAMRPTYMITESWFFPISVIVAALHDYLPNITKEDEENIKTYLYPCGDAVIQAFGKKEKKAVKVLSSRIADYTNACRNEMVCGYSWYGQGKVIYHDLEEIEQLTNRKAHDVQCSLLFNDIIYYVNMYGELPEMKEIGKLKSVVVKSPTNYAKQIEKIYDVAHPLASALFSEVKSRLGV